MRVSALDLMPRSVPGFFHSFERLTDEQSPIPLNVLRFARGNPSEVRVFGIDQDIVFPTAKYHAGNQQNG